MNKKIKKLWLRALRSGKYTQGKNRLKTKDRFCCLGVLCDLHAKKFNKKWRINGFYLGDNIVLSSEVMKWAGLEDCAPIVEDGNNKQASLDVFNDGLMHRKIKGRSFKQIANYIEKSIK